ncbi:wee1-like protein kinase 1-A isoform X2 [Pseudomyrmex gracilis]|uniref:wee1-like protein kinase 1-A isoform X2 n=1 Tax=Pseudomyrmex gracilis TaxID=219809 RepID=UPI000995B112|nr:wee1-like protein kinase 1-A isoform X2 [Pseudomyrmex gracilis]
MEVAQKVRYDACDMQNEELSWSCRTSSPDCETGDIMDSSTDDFGSPPTPLQPRKLFTTDCNDNENDVPTNNNKTGSVKEYTPNTKGIESIHVHENSSVQGLSMTCSPPYKRVRALRLFDTPTTPKTLIEKSAMPTPVPSRCPRTFSLDKPRPSKISPITKISPSYQTKSEKPAANVNPFTPTSMLITARKRSRSKRSLNGDNLLDIPKFNLADSEDSDNEYEHVTKRVALQDSNISRYHKEFHELGLIGTGDFGSVYKCVNRLDGCTYAIKKSLKPVAGCIAEKIALNEVYAHAVLGKHQHVVRYYSAWAEDNHMIIQNEYCNGGSLADVIEKNRKQNKYFTEAEMRQLLLHIAEGLRYIHSMQLVHMDIKPGNIFISKENRLLALNYDSADDGFADEEDIAEDEITYKIGDLGHVTSAHNPPPQIEEGDCRYLALEILHENYSHLQKADIFALGMTVYEAGGGGLLPKNGPLWQEIREGKLKELSHCSRDLNNLLKLMVNPDPEIRPSAASLIQHRVLCPPENKTKEQLRRELNAEKIKNEILSQKLHDAAVYLKTIESNIDGSNNERQSRPFITTKSSRTIGKKVNRSNSTTNF